MEKEKAISVKNNDVQPMWTKDQQQLILDTVAKGATENEFKLFLYTCRRTGLDPLTRQIFFVKRNTKRPDGSWSGQMTVQTGIDGYRAIADRSKKLAGIDDAVYDTEKDECPGKATVTVYKMIDGERRAFTATARWNEYAPDMTSKQSFMWRKMPYLMLAKCAEALALRKAFPNDLSGLYTTEEMAQSDNNIKNDIKIGKEEIVPGSNNLKTCPICGNAHNGKWPKCLECWKKDKAGETKSVGDQMAQGISNSREENAQFSDDQNVKHREEKTNIPV